MTALDPRALKAGADVEAKWDGREFGSLGRADKQRYTDRFAAGVTAYLSALPQGEPVAYMHPIGAIWRTDNYPAGMDFSTGGWEPLYQKQDLSSPQQAGVKAPTDAMVEALKTIGAPDEMDLVQMGNSALRGWAYAAWRISIMLEKNRAQGMIRSMDQWRNMVPRAVAGGSQAQVEYALLDAKHDIEALWSVLAAIGAGGQTAPSVVAMEALETYYARQIEWSRDTFGPAKRTKGVIDHIRKELAEIETEPDDLSEWVDVVILAMDGFWRHGGSADGLMPALLAKQAKNMARQWPDWRTMSEDRAIEHDRSGEAAPAAPTGAQS